VKKLHRHRRSDKAGLPPGTLVHIGAERMEEVTLHSHRYDADAGEEMARTTLAEALARRGDGLLWLDVAGLHDAELLAEVGQAFGLHPLAMEDVLNTEQRPKFEDYGDYLFVVLKRLRYDRPSGRLDADQISLVLGKDFVLSFQEAEAGLFEPVRQRLRSARSRLRKAGPDYLLHALIDCVVDDYFAVLETLGEEIEALELQILDRPSPVAMRTLHRLKRELVAMRRSVWPLREVIGGLDRSDSPLLSPGVELYLRDVYDHTVHVIESLENDRDTLSGLLDVHLSGLSNRMNEIMKLLTIISTIFIPLTFIAGVYGMNFKHMPELEWGWGYFTVLGLMFVLALGMLVFFRRKHWL
jgi:magnesium transporter